MNVNVREQDGLVMVVVPDDGGGFEIAGDTSGFGPAGMRERIAFADGGP